MIRFDTSQLMAAVQQTVDQVTSAIDEEGLRAVGFSGAEPFREEAKRNARARAKTYTIHDNIIVKRLDEESDGARRQVYLVTVRSGTYGGSDAFYWRFVENGHKFVPRNTKLGKRGQKTGWKEHRLAAELEYGTASAPAYPFMRPAYESKKQVSVDAMTSTLTELLARNSTGS
ncbi:HK97 gp10 family phage protein [Oxalobacteraceae sp. CFBP 8753]|nr:HK97 gp10 family phage protein [Oxalobacteraceae sp. CFBP 8753]